MTPLSDSAPQRQCRNCGAPAPANLPCAACALTQALLEDPQTPNRAAGASESANASSNFDAESLPCRFGMYLVRRELAIGGMGAVYEAEDLRSHRKVALKLLRSVLLATDAERSRFRLESETAAGLDHPHIVPVYEVGEEGRQPYFTMKFMDGGSLAERLRSGPLAPGAAARLISEIARAVHYAHTHGVLHRDIKPGNVLFDGHGEPHLTDFGLAKLVHAETSLTISSAHLGTPEYMSPEQAAGRNREISTASDVWALGAMLYHAVAGRPPFSGATHAETFRRIADDEPAPLGRGSRSSTSGSLRDLETICLRCLEKEPNRRLASAGVLAEERASTI